MLAPSDRAVLTEALHPPDGYRVDRVVATTYSLDLIALLTVPLSFTLLAGGGMDDSGRVDPLALLEALRRHAGRIIVFCEAGRIAVPPRRQLLFGHLEDCIVEARAPKGGAFHPKLILVRYAPVPADGGAGAGPGGGDPPIVYRLLCSTRNLTLDRSWDTLLVLDGELVTSRVKAFARNRPLARFLDALPGCALRPLSDLKVTSLREMADELLRVHFELPEGFGTDTTDLTFWPIGLDERPTWPFEGRTDRMLVVSPFVDMGCLNRLDEQGDVCALVSRPEELDLLSPTALEGIESCYVLTDAAESEPAAQDGVVAPSPAEPDAPHGSAAGIEVEPSGALLRGLHAKLFLADSGWGARLWTGSANATGAAFTKNVEFLVELRGRRSKIGIDALLGTPVDGTDRNRALRLRDLLSPYQPPDEPRTPDPIERKLEQMVEDCRRAVTNARIVARVRERPGDTAPLYDLQVEATAPHAERLPDGATCTIRPISLSELDAVPIRTLQGALCSFQSLAFESLTAFAAVSATAATAGRQLKTELVLVMPLDGAPEDRANRLLLALLSNRERLLRYLLMLLAGPELVLHDFPTGESKGPSERGSSFGPFGLPLLEPLLRTLSADPARLEPVDRLVRDLRATEEGQKLLPVEFLVLWEAIRAASPALRDQTGEDAHGGR